MMRAFEGRLHRGKLEFIPRRILLPQPALLKERAAKSSADTAPVVFSSMRLITGFDLVTMFS
jgi:hypothetical protein